MAITGYDVLQDTKTIKDIKIKQEENSQDILDINTQLGDMISFKNSKGQINGLAELDGTGNVPKSQLGNVEQTWEKIGDVTLSSDVAQVDFDNLNEQYRMFKVIASMKGSSTSKRDLNITFNDNANNIYSVNYIRGSSTTVVGARIDGSFLRIVNAISHNSFGFNLFEMYIYNTKNDIKTSNFQLAELNTTTATTVEGNITGSGSCRINAPINKITLKPSVNNFSTYCEFVLWGAK